LTNWGCPGSPRDLNPSNRPVRTRMPGGVAGVVEDITPRPYADSWPQCAFTEQRLPNRLI
jgi:hypothetical protein